MHRTALDGVAKREKEREERLGILTSLSCKLTHSFDFIFMALLGVYLTYRSLFICINYIDLVNYTWVL